MINPGWRPFEHPELSAEQCAAVTSRIFEVLSSWEGTPYCRGQQCKGTAVDCIRFLSGFSDELYGRCTAVERLPQDASLHSPATARAAMRTIIRHFRPLLDVTDQPWEPGDALIVGPRYGGPGHVIAIGTSPGEIWHAGLKRVQRTLLSVLDSSSYNMKVFCCYRPLDKDRWYREAG